MNHTVDAGFKELDANLNLEPYIRQQAQDLHNDIRDALRAAGAIVGSFLQGSFARKTMLKVFETVGEDHGALVSEFRKKLASAMN